MIPGSGRYPGGEQGNPFQYSGLENPTDRGARWATVHWVAQRLNTAHLMEDNFISGSLTEFHPQISYFQKASHSQVLGFRHGIWYLSLSILSSRSIHVVVHISTSFLFIQFSSVQSLSHSRLFATPWTAPLQASLSITNSRSLLRLMSIESVMPSNHLVLCCPLLLLLSIFPASESFPISQFFAFFSLHLNNIPMWGQSIFCASIHLSMDILGCFHLLTLVISAAGFPDGSDNKGFACNAGDLDSIPGSGRSPGEGNSYPHQYSCLENSMDRGTWLAIVHAVASEVAQ